MIVVMLCVLGFILVDFGRRQEGFVLREKLVYLSLLVLAAAMILPDTLGWDWPGLAELLEPLPLLPVAKWGGV